MARHIDGPRVDPDSGLVVGEIELDGGLPPEEPDSDQQRYDSARTAILRDEAERQTERDLWDRGIEFYAYGDESRPGVGTRDLGGYYEWAVGENRAEAERSALREPAVDRGANPEVE